MNLEIVSTIIFFSLIGILLLKNRKSLEFSYGIVIKRWKRGLEFIDNIVKKHSKALRILGYFIIGFGIIVGLAGLIGLFYADVTLQKLFGLALPTAGGYQYPGPVIGVPFWYWLITVFVILFVHETTHGIFARFAKVPIKNYGIMLLLVLPIGAFVEPYMERVKKLKLREKLQIFASGSFANFVVAIFCIILALLFSALSLIPAVRQQMIEPYGVIFNGTIDGYPAHVANMTGVITGINGVQIKTFEDLSGILNNTKPGSQITVAMVGSVKNITVLNGSSRCMIFTNICIKSPNETGVITGDGNYTIRTASRPNNQTGSFIGITSPSTFFAEKSWVAIILNLLKWLFGLNLGVSIANLLPWKPFDGGLMFEEISVKKFKNKGKMISNILTAIVIILVLFNLFCIKVA